MAAEQLYFAMVLFFHLLPRLALWLILPPWPRLCFLSQPTLQQNAPSVHTALPKQQLPAYPLSHLWLPSPCDQSHRDCTHISRVLRCSCTVLISLLMAQQQGQPIHHLLHFGVSLCERQHCCVLALCPGGQCGRRPMHCSSQGCPLPRRRSGGRKALWGFILYLEPGALPV